MNRFEKLKAWAGTDGLLHAVVCYAIVITFFPIVGLWWSLAIAIIIAVGKEIYDWIAADTFIGLDIHDLICDSAGIVIALLMTLIWWLFG